MPDHTWSCLAYISLSVLICSCCVHENMFFFNSRIVNDFLYFAGQMSVENLPGNKFVNFALIAATEFPSAIVGEWASNILGRRWSHFGCSLIGTIIFLAIIPISLGTWLQWLIWNLFIQPWFEWVAILKISVCILVHNF